MTPLEKADELYNKMKKTDIDNFNKKGNCHGYQEWYSKSGKLMFRTIYKNGQTIRYDENHYHKKIIFYIR